EAEENKDKDQKLKDEKETRYKAESLINSLKESLNSEEGKKSDPKQKEEAEKQIKEFETLLSDNKYDELKQKISQFEAMASQFAEAMKKTEKESSTNEKDDSKVTEEKSDSKKSDTPKNKK
ncbi:MAG: molecular chaperone DnaK, partial [Malacoplasma sp.]